MRPAWVDVDLGAVVRNAGRLAAEVAPAELCAVVKADAYGHGAAPVSRAVVAALGADAWLAVALVQEGVELRADEALREARLLLLSEPAPDEWPACVAAGLRPTLYSAEGVEAAVAAVRAAGAAPLPVHLDVDTGMRRVGVRPDDAVALAQAVVARPELVLEGLRTHFPVADEPDHPFTAVQLARFGAVLDELRAVGIDPPVVHAANSAGGIVHRGARLGLVRSGIALYGIPPAPGLRDRCGPDGLGLEPVLSLRARVSFVKRVAAGEGISYGLRHVFGRDATVATVPLGYADGVPRRLFATGGEVLLGGRRRPIVGVVTMDQLMVDCGDDAVERGDEVVLLGRQGDEEVDATEWAERLGTIAYEVVCGLSARLPRRHGGTC